jgi:hypothetical protein
LHEDFWAGALGIAVTKSASLSWEVDSEVPLRASRAQELVKGTNWVSFLSRHLQDFLCTDNGTFVEIVRATKGAGSRIIGLVHLDSLRCTRTGDPDIPVIYRDKMNNEHEIKRHQIFFFSDMEDPSETFYGVGHCAASRSYRSIYKMAIMDRFSSEKIAGRRPLAINFVNSISPTQMESIQASAQADADRRGIMSYMGAIIVPLLDAEKEPSVATIDLAGIPDGFNAQEEHNKALLAYANAIGMDPQDLQPLTGQPLGTGTQSEVLEEKSRGKGLSAWRQMFTHSMNEWVLDEKTTYAFHEDDLRDQAKKADISSKRAQVSGSRIQSGITTADQERQILVDLEELPKEFLEQDITPGEKLTDTEIAPEDREGSPQPQQGTQSTNGGTQSTNGGTVPGAGGPVGPIPNPFGLGNKEARSAEDVLGGVLNKARELIEDDQEGSND